MALVSPPNPNKSEEVWRNRVSGSADNQATDKGGENGQSANDADAQKNNSLLDRERSANSQNNQTGGKGIRKRLFGSTRRKAATAMGVVSIGGGLVLLLVNLFSPFFGIINAKNLFVDDAGKYVKAAHGRRVQNVLGNYVFSTDDGKFNGYKESGFFGPLKNISSERLLSRLNDGGFSVDLKDPEDPSRGFKVSRVDIDTGDLLEEIDVRKGRTGSFKDFYGVVSREFPDKNLITRAKYAKQLYNRFRISRLNVLKLSSAKKFDDALDGFKDRFRKSVVFDTDGSNVSIDGNNSYSSGGVDADGNPLPTESLDDNITGSISPESQRKVLDELTDSIDAPSFKGAASGVTKGITRGIKSATSGVAGVPSLACQIKSYAAGFASLTMLYRTINMMDAAVLWAALGEVVQTNQIETAATAAMLSAAVYQMSKKNPETNRNFFSSSSYQRSIGKTVPTHENNLLSYSVQGGFGGRIQQGVDLANNIGLNGGVCSFATSIIGELGAVAIGAAINVALGVGGFFTLGAGWGALASNIAVGVTVSLTLDAMINYGSQILAPIVAGAEVTGDEYGDQIATFMHTGLTSMYAFSGLAHGMSFLTNAQVAEWDAQLHQERILVQKEKSLITRIFSPNERSLTTAMFGEIMGGVDLTSRVSTITSLPSYIASRIIDISSQSVASITGFSRQTAFAAPGDDLAATPTGAPYVGKSLASIEAEEDTDSPLHPSNALASLVAAGHIDQQSLDPLSDEAKEYYDQCVEVTNGVLLYNEEGSVNEICAAGHSTLSDQLSSVYGNARTLEELVNNMNGDYGNNIIGSAGSTGGGLNIEGLNLGQPDSRGYYTMPDPTDYEYVFYAGSCKREHTGSANLIKVLYSAAKEFHLSHPSLRLRIGELNGAGHKTHKNGLNADMNLYEPSPTDIANDRVYVGRNVPMYTEVGYSEYQNAMESLIKLLIDTRLVDTVIFNDPEIISNISTYIRSSGLDSEGVRIISASGHNNHVHIKVKGEPGPTYAPNC